MHALDLNEVVLALSWKQAMNHSSFIMTSGLDTFSVELTFAHCKRLRTGRASAILFSLHQAYLISPKGKGILLVPPLLSSIVHWPLLDRKMIAVAA